MIVVHPAAEDPGWKPINNGLLTEFLTKRHCTSLYSLHGRESSFSSSVCSPGNAEKFSFLFQETPRSIFLSRCLCLSQRKETEMVRPNSFSLQYIAFLVLVCAVVSWANPHSYQKGWSSYTS